jgi:hypothetical protein
MHDPSPNLSPKRREALIPPSLVGKGGRGVRSVREFKVSKSFPEMSIMDYAISACAYTPTGVLIPAAC